jgi:hypothetical protein
MNIQAINDEVPFTGIWIALNRLLNVGNKVGFRARISTTGGNSLTCNHIKISNQGLGAMTDILKLSPLDFTRSER